MTLSVPRIRHYLQTFALEKMFIEELGWDRHSTQLTVQVDNQAYLLTAFAEKRGVQIFECRADAEGNLPDYPTRRKIEKQVTKSAYEHLIIFMNTDKTLQIWQWVSRQPGNPAAYREHHYQPQHHSGDSLIQKLESITFTLNEEEGLTLPGIVFRLHDAFDRDRVTKKFYDHFKKEHGKFLDFIQGITEQGDREWYASLMLNRLMFVYFIQRKGFLDGDVEYLKNRLKMVQEREGKDKFLTFYRYFLVRLFHEGFAQQPAQRTPDLEDLLGKVPYLDGGLFELHELEQKHPDIDVPDKGFERLFGFFDQYEWHLDTRPLRNDREINPDVLGYIFEKYINQKQMGAYYTKEDITGYISKNTIIPYLFDAAEKKCAIAFQPDSALWRLLRDDPDRYIYPAVRKGVIDENGEVIPLPAEIEKGIKNVSQRGEWNRPADSDYALPTEIWREHVARRQRCLELREKLKAGEIHQINDLITYNLDIRQFVEDVITDSEGPELLRAFYKAISTITVLDPTCGSGAFLFAALNILEPLYEACLERMQAFLDDLDRSGDRHRPEKFSDFRRTLAEIDKHPNRLYFIQKSIIVNNLYGVDIMQEAVEICKLRLFLKLVAQVDKVKHLEPLPDIDFNIRAGNTLVGFATLDEVKRTLEDKLPFYKDQVDRIIEEAQIVERAFQRFQEMQISQNMDASEFAEAKRQLRTRFNRLTDDLDKYMSFEYGIDANKLEKYERWLDSHQPFHWFAEFYGIMTNGGFDVIIGNPPYVAYKKVFKDYKLPLNYYTTEPCGNLYGYIMERCFSLINKSSWFGMIIPVSIISGESYKALAKVSFRSQAWVSSYSNRPGKLFYGVEQRLVIYLRCQQTVRLYTTSYFHWYERERANLFFLIKYHPTKLHLIRNIPYKIGNQTEATIIDKFYEKRGSIAKIEAPGQYECWYHDGPTYWIRSLPFIPKVAKKGSSRSNHYHKLNFQTPEDAFLICSILNSSSFYFFFKKISNCRDFGIKELYEFPIGEIHTKLKKRLSHLGRELGEQLKADAKPCTRVYPSGKVEYEEYYPAKCKLIIDRIDFVLSKHYGFSEEELDFILNYDIKYRMG